MRRELADEMSSSRTTILPILSGVSEELKAAGQGDQVEEFLSRAETCPSREELVHLARRYVERYCRAGG